METGHHRLLRAGLPLDSKTAFVNAIPVFIASDAEWAAKFEEAGVPIVGDDIKSQVGATITHRMLTRLFEDRGVAIDRPYQLNFGGNMDFKNTPTSTSTSATRTHPGNAPRMRTQRRGPPTGSPPNSTTDHAND